MSWQTEMTTIIRYLIYDFSDTPTYNDTKIQQAIVVAAQMTLQDITFSTVYNISVPSVSISPDPTEGTKDDAFINLVCLKTACLIDNWELRAKLPTAGISMRSGPESIDTRGVLAAYQYLQQNGACKAFEQAKWEFEVGNMCPGQAILGPFTGENVNVDFYGSFPNTPRTRY